MSAYARDIAAAVDDSRDAAATRNAEAAQRVAAAQFARRSDIAELQARLAALEGDVATLKKTLGL